MTVLDEKKKEINEPSAARLFLNTQSNDKTAFHFPDNQPQSIAQQNIQGRVNNRSHVKQLKSFQEKTSTRQLIEQTQDIKEIDSISLGSQVKQSPQLKVVARKQAHRNVAQLSISASAFKKKSQTGIGAWIGKDMRPSSIRQIDTMLRQYHMIRDSKNTRALQNTYNQRSKALHQLQTHVFRTIQNLGYNPNSGHHEAIMILLDDIQREQQRLSTTQIQANLKLWVPGRSQMLQNEQKSMDAAWRSITHNRGRLKVSEKAATTIAKRQKIQGFREEIHASMARLMGTPTGRRLLMGLDAGPHEVTTEPTYADMTRGQQRALMKAYGNECIGVDREQELPGGGFTPGEGGNSLVRMLPRYMDTEMLDFNAAGQPILSPAFIGLSHELIHALHNQRGVAWDPETHGAERFKAGQSFAHYHNPEEFHTIAYQHAVPSEDGVPLAHVTENMIRTESGLSKREGHARIPRRDVTYSKIRGWLNRGKKLKPRLL